MVIGTDCLIVPWLQNFSWPKTYSSGDVAAQIKAAKDVGLNSWYLWNDSSKVGIGAPGLESRDSSGQRAPARCSTRSASPATSPRAAPTSRRRSWSSRPTRRGSRPATRARSRTRWTATAIRSTTATTAPTSASTPRHHRPTSTPAATPYTTIERGPDDPSGPLSLSRPTRVGGFGEHPVREPRRIGRVEGHPQRGFGGRRHAPTVGTPAGLDRHVLRRVGLRQVRLRGDGEPTGIRVIQHRAGQETTRSRRQKAPGPRWRAAPRGCSRCPPWLPASVMIELQQLVAGAIGP